MTREELKYQSEEWAEILREIEESKNCKCILHEFNKIYEIEYSYSDGYETYFTHETLRMDKDKAISLAKENAKERGIFDNFTFLGFSDETKYYKNK